MTDNKQTTIKIQDVAIPFSSIRYSRPINLKVEKLNGFFSLQLGVTGDGTVKAEYLLSNEPKPSTTLTDADWVTPSSASDIVTAHTKTSGTSGVDLYSFSPPLANHMALKFTNTSSSAAATINATLAIQ